jgi:hypothetical protein
LRASDSKGGAAGWAGGGVEVGEGSGGNGVKVDVGSTAGVSPAGIVVGEGEGVGVKVDEGSSTTGVGSSACAGALVDWTTGTIVGSGGSERLFKKEPHPVSKVRFNNNDKVNRFCPTWKRWGKVLFLRGWPNII